jgi:tetratricopeptide (TPR) repeat protein
MGLAYTGLDKFKEAIEAYKKAMDLNPVREQKHRLKKMKPDA